MTTFIKAEEQNYSLYNYVNKLNSDIDTIEEQNKAIKNEKFIKQIQGYQGKLSSLDNVLHDLRFVQTYDALVERDCKTVS